jgi:hypothetical protein
MADKITLEVEQDDLDLVIQALRQSAMHFVISAEEMRGVSDSMRETWRTNAMRLDRYRFRLQEVRHTRG